MKVHVVEEIGDILEGGDSYHGKQPNTGSRRFVLLKRLVTPQKEEIATMENYLKDIKSIIDQLEAISVTILKDVAASFFAQRIPALQEVAHWE
jgi:hypothetical protein